jgi:starvation-inducible outer membrane lipoprotein
MVDQTVLDFVKGQRKVFADQKEKALKDKGLSEFVKLDIGENVLTLQPEIPSVRENNFGKEQFLFKVTQGDKVKTWSVTTNSPMAPKLVDLLLKAPIKVIVIRTGLGKDTRIDLK